MSLHIERHGHGTDLVLLHGWGMDGSIWGTFAVSLAQDFRVHAIDLPGHGRSPRDLPLTLDTLADALRPAIPPGSLVCGWSLGGMLALRLAQGAERRVRAMALIDSTPRFCAGDAWPHGAVPEVLSSFMAELEGDPSSLLARFRASMCRGDARERSLRRTMAGLAAAPTDLQALREGLDILRDADLRPQVATIEAPALILHGELDTVIPPAAGRWLAAQMPDARLHLIAQCAHLPFLSQPEPSAQLVRQFARECGLIP